MPIVIVGARSGSLVIVWASLLYVRRGWQDYYWRP